MGPRGKRNIRAVMRNPWSTGCIWPRHVIQPRGLPEGPKIWWCGVGAVAVLIAPRAAEINTATVHPLPNFQTCGEPCSPDDKAHMLNYTGKWGQAIIQSHSVAGFSVWSWARVQGCSVAGSGTWVCWLEPMDQPFAPTAAGSGLWTDPMYGIWPVDQSCDTHAACMAR